LPVKYRIHIVIAILLTIQACARMVSPAAAPFSVSSGSTLQPTQEALAVQQVPRTRPPGAPVLTPTPDPPHNLPALRKDPEQYTVQAGDTLGKIAQRYSISLESLLQANPLPNPDYLEVGQALTIPAPVPEGVSPAFKVIPDSELVYGPASMDFDVADFVKAKNGYLAQHREEVDGEMLSGTRIVRRIAYEYSVSPRLLLAVLEYQSGWVTQPNPDPETLEYPLGVFDSWRAGLYRQLAWAADNLNLGYYLWRVEGVGAWSLQGGKLISIHPTINAGTAGVQHLFSLLYGRDGWQKAVTEAGLFATYQGFFGYPFDLALEPVVPSSLVQPRFQLPFETGITWNFTGGPHGGWGDGSGWAALDFAPPGRPLGCVTSDEWVVAIGDGPIIRAADGAVIQDLDVPGAGGVVADGKEGTGWVILYMHIETRDRVQSGTYLHAGERIGHPSCEGGYSTGTHVHLARRYNGEWIPADQTLPFVLDGWVSRGAGKQYDGILERDGLTIEALEGRSSLNAISR
jgi:LysM repeat protein